MLARIQLLILICAGLAQAQLASFEAFVHEQMNRDRTPGLTIGYIHKGDMWVKGFGFSDLENQVPAKEISAYRLASVTKTMTAVAVLKLVEAGKINLDAEVQTYVPSFPRKPWPVTVRQLLGHLGGISHYKNYDLEGHFKFPMDTEASLAVFKDFDLVAEPGTHYTYSSYGYNLLGAVIEGASGESYGAFLRHNIWLPAGMLATRMDSADALIPNRVRGYRLSASGDLINSEFVDISSRFAAGGTRSTVPDMLRFAQSLMQGDLLTDASRTLMWTSMKTTNGVFTDYGMGWSITDVNGRFAVAHGGAQAETRTYLIAFPNDQLAIAVACNFEGADRMPYVQRLFETVVGETWSLPLVADEPRDQWLLDAVITCFRRGLSAFEYFGPHPQDREATREAFAYLNRVATTKKVEKLRELVNQGRHPIANEAFVTVGRTMAQYLVADLGASWLAKVHSEGPLAFFVAFQELMRRNRDIPRAFQLPKRLQKTLPEWSDSWNKLWTPEIQHAWKQQQLDLQLNAKDWKDAPIKPDLSPIFEDESQRLFLAGDSKGAIERLEHCLVLFPNDDASRVQAAIGYLVMGDLKRAQSYLEQAHKLRPDGHAGPGRLNGYAYMLKNRGLVESGSSLLQLAIDLHPKVANLYDSYAEFLLETGHREEAIEWYEKALEVDPNFKNARDMLHQINQTSESEDSK